MALAAAKDVYLGHLVQEIDQILLLAICMAITVVVFNASQLANLPSYTAAVMQSLGDVIWLNLFTAVSWASFIAARRFRTRPS